MHEMCLCVISWPVPYNTYKQPHSTLTYAHLHNVSWHIWRRLIICRQLLGIFVFSHINWAHSVCVDSHSSYELRFSMCTFIYIHITNMQPCRNNQNILAWTENFKKKKKQYRGFRVFSKSVFFFFLLSAAELISLHTPTLPPSFIFSPLITTVPQRALWRALLYSPAHHHAKRWLSLHCKPLL